MLETPTHPAPPANWLPSLLVLLTSAVAIALTAGAWIWRRMGRHDA